ncbi:MAG: GTP pyrophosphokinase family protein, partial [Defluviitaleaceae bacterium]|nr:GTP pyrophosphokinase family protein [Defluviitaleaceae bacterium]
MPVLFSQEEFAKLKDLLVLYGCALKNISTRIDILLDDFKYIQRNNPVEHIKSRIKSPESIAEKLHRLGFEITAENARKCLYDIAGMRVICAYATDIFFIAEVLKSQPDINLVIEKDYVTNPKPSGYRSYHLIVEVPVFLSRETEKMP